MAINNKPKEERVRPLRKSKGFIILVVIVGIFLIGNLIPTDCGCGSNANQKPDKPVEKPTGSVEFKELVAAEGFSSLHVPKGWHKFRVKLGDKKSGWVFIPPGHYVTVDADYADIYFPGKEMMEIRSGNSVDGSTHPAHSSFQISGVGEAEIYVQPTSR